MLTTRRPVEAALLLGTSQFRRFEQTYMLRFRA
jgi:hypothetical protein